MDWKWGVRRNPLLVAAITCQHRWPYQLQAKHIRHHLRRAAAALRHRRALAGVPILFANAFPKSGTHLLTQVLQGFTRLGPAVDSGLPAVVMFDGPTGQPRPRHAILSDLARLRPGDIAYGHLHAAPDIVSALCGEGGNPSGFSPFFIYRDPRDVVVSHVHYVTEIEANHVHHAHYRALPDFDARLRVSILGRPELDVPFPDIRARFAPYLGWLECPEVCVLRFEEFVADREAAIERVIEHAATRGFPVTLPRRDAVRLLSEGVNPAKSPTFRAGRVGGWRAVFAEDHRRLFKEKAGDLLVRLGYEKDRDW